MNRRRFLAVGGVVGATALAGCAPSYEYEIADVEGMDDSNVFADVNIEDGDGLRVHLTPEATLEEGADSVEGAERCEGEDDPSPFETDIGPGEESVYIPLGCIEGDDFEVHVVAKGPAGQPVDYITVTIDIIEN